MGVFLEDHARALLLLHTALAVGAVASSTHLVIWLWKLRRGQHGRLRAVRRFAVIAACLHLGAFVAGSLMYPTYKVRVKVSYLQDADAVDADDDARATAASQIAARYQVATPAPAGDRAAGAARAAAWFDAKEHWVAIGLPVSLLLAVLLGGWRPEPGEGGEVGGFVFGLAATACATLWFAAMVGVVTASWRAVG